MNSKRPEYHVWSGMKRRCFAKNDTSYRLYGARGITVCDRWRNSFKAFLADMGPRPSPEHSIDRINNDGNYEPGNCRWATRSQQMRNTRHNRIVTIGGRKMTMVEAAELVGIGQGDALIRLDYLAHRLNLPDEVALSFPVAKTRSQRGKLGWAVTAWARNYRRLFPRED